MGIFDALSEQALSLEELAERLHCDPQGLLLFLQLLVSAGYLRHRRGHYANTRMAQRWLTSASPDSVAPSVVRSPDIVAIWDHLPEVVRGINRRYVCHTLTMPASSTRAALARHYAGLASLAMALGSDVVNRVKIPRGARTLFDIGGSHAAYSVLFCQISPASRDHSRYRARNRSWKIRCCADKNGRPHELYLWRHRTR